MHRILSYLKETLAAFAAEAPLLLILDDLHWADELSLLFLESLKAEFFERSPVLVIGTYRTEEKSAAIERLIQAPSAESISLGRLSLPAVRAMIGDMLVLDDAPAPALRARWPPSPTLPSRSGERGPDAGEVAPVLTDVQHFVA